MIIISVYQWDVGGSWVVGVLVVDSFESFSIYSYFFQSIFFLVYFANIKSD